MSSILSLIERLAAGPDAATGAGPQVDLSAARDAGLEQAGAGPALPRGLRNNNPGNIRRSAIPWEGKVAGTDAEFETFATPDAGIRALEKNLTTYNTKHGLSTPRELIGRWAPSNENNTENYARFVAKKLGVTPDTPLDLSNPAVMSNLRDAIIEMENGQNPYAGQARAPAQRTALPDKFTLPDPREGAARRLESLTSEFGREAAPARATPISDLLARDWGDAKSSGDTEWADYGKGVLGSAGALAGGLVAIGEYTARGLAADDRAGTSFWSDIIPPLAEMRRGADRFAAGWFERMSDEAKDRMAREVTNLDPDKTIWQGGVQEFISSVGLKAASSAAPTLVPLLGYALMARLGMGSVAASVYGMNEGTLSLGMIAADTAKTIEEAPVEELMGSEQFKRRLQEAGGNVEAARQAFIIDAQGATPIIAGIAVGVIAKGVGGAMDRIFNPAKGLSLFRRTALGGFSEGMQEFGQSGAERIAENVVTRVYNSETGIWDGVLEEASQGTLVGTPIGGGVSAVFGRRPQPIADPDTPVPGDIKAAIGAADAPSSPSPGPLGPWSPRTPAAPFVAAPTQGDLFGGGGPGTAPQQLDLPLEPEQQAGLPPEQLGLFDGSEEQGDMFTPPAGTGRAPPRPAAPAGLQRPGEGFQMRGLNLGQQPLGLRDRSTGLAPGEVIEPLPEAGFVPPPMPPPVVPRPDDPGGPPPPNPLQGSLIPANDASWRNPPPPDAEPLEDLQAQFEDLQDPNSGRMGVYLSPQNIDFLEEIGELDLILSAGVGIRNFDGAGGIMVARDAATAKELTQLKNSGAGLEEVLGLATGAGPGKPYGATKVVQKLGRNGGVIRERLAADAEVAAVLKEFGDNARVVDLAWALRRRQDRRKMNKQAAAKRKEAAGQFPTRADKLRYLYGSPATKPLAGAAQQENRRDRTDKDVGRGLIGLATEVGAEERKRRDVDERLPKPEAVEFADKESRDVEAELAPIQQELADIKRRGTARATNKDLSDEQRAAENDADKARKAELQARQKVLVGKKSAAKQARDTLKAKYAEFYNRALILTERAKAMKMVGTSKELLEAQDAADQWVADVVSWMQNNDIYTQAEALAEAAMAFSPEAAKEIRAEMAAQRRKEQAATDEDAETKAAAQRDVNRSVELSEDVESTDQQRRGRARSTELSPSTIGDTRARELSELAEESDPRRFAQPKGKREPSSRQGDKIRAALRRLLTLRQAAAISAERFAEIPREVRFREYREAEARGATKEELYALRKKLAAERDAEEARNANRDKAAQEVLRKLTEWLTEYRTALRTTIPADKEARRRNFRLQRDIGILSEAISRLRAERTGRNVVTNEASAGMADAVAAVVFAAGRAGVAGKVDARGFEQSVVEGPEVFLAYLKANTAARDGFVLPDDLSPATLKEMNDVEINALWTRAVLSTSRKRQSDSVRIQIVDAIRKAHGERFGTKRIPTVPGVQADGKPYEIRIALPNGSVIRVAAENREVSARELFYEIFNSSYGVTGTDSMMSYDQLKEWYLKGYSATVIEDGKTRKIEFPPVASKLPAPIPVVVLAKRVGRSDKIQEILRQHSLERAEARGGKTGTAGPPTGLRAASGTSTAPVGVGKVNVKVLSTDKIPRDLSVPGVARLMEEAQGYYTQLEAAIDVFEKKLAEYRSPDGDKLTGPMLFAKAYARSMLELAKTMRKADLLSKAGLKQLQEMTSFLSSTAALDFGTFTQVMSDLFDANERYVQRKSDETADEKKAAVERNNENLRRSIGSFAKGDKANAKNPVYRKYVRPIVRKVAAAVAEDGWNSYELTVTELQDLYKAMALLSRGKPGERRWLDLLGPNALKSLDAEYAALTDKQRETMYAEIYRRAQPSLEAAGVFDRDKALLRKYQQQFGAETEPNFAVRAAVTVESKEDRLTRLERSPPSDRRKTAVQFIESINRQMADLADRINRFAYGRVRDTDEGGQKRLPLGRMEDTDSIDAIIDAEKSMIEALEAMGAWVQESAGLGLGRIEYRSFATVEQDLNAAKRKLAAAEKKGKREQTAELAAEVARLSLELRGLAPEVQAPDSIRYRQIGERLRAGRLSMSELRAAAKVLDRGLKPHIRLRTEARKDVADDELFMELSPEAVAQQPVGSAADQQAERVAADRLRAVVQGDTTVGNVISTLLESLPPDHFYVPLLQKFAAVTGQHDTPVFFATLPSRVYGSYGTSRYGAATLKLSQAVFDLRGPGVASSRFLHTVMHEMAHAFTMGKLTSAGTSGDRSLLRSADYLRRVGKRALKARGLLTPGTEYAFRNAYEFVSEAQTNRELQAALRQVRAVELSSDTLWGAFVNLVSRLLGLSPQYETLLDAVLAVADSSIGPTTPGASARTVADAELERINKEIGDPDTAPVFDESGDLFLEAVRKPLLQSIRDAARARTDILTRAKAAPGANAFGVRGLSIKAMTQRQIEDFFSEKFAGKNGERGPLHDYMRAFFARNSNSAETMEQAEAVSRRWNKLESADPAAAKRLSRIMRDSTVLGIHPDQPFKKGRNAHLKDGQLNDWTELATEFNALPQEARDLYAKVSEFYAATVQAEVKQLLLNALRASKFTVGKFTMTEADVDLEGITRGDWLQKKLDINLADMRKARDKMIRDYRDAAESGLPRSELREMRKGVNAFRKEVANTEQELRLILRMAAIPFLKKGPYFPLMRNGDYVVTARKMVELKTFPTRKARREYQDALGIKDPSLQFGYPSSEPGSFTLSVSEVETRFAETYTEIMSQQAELKEAYGADVVSDPDMRENIFRNEATIANNAALNSLLGKLNGNPAAQAAMREFYLRSLSDRSFRKRELSRKNIRGVDPYNQHRAFKHYATASAYYTAQLRYGWKMATAMAEMRKFVKDFRGDKVGDKLKLRQIVQELERRDNMLASQHDVIDAFRKTTEIGQLMLLTTPSYWMLNATQPWLVTAPYLASYTSVGDALAALGAAQKLVISPLVTQSVKSAGGLKALWDRVSAEESFGVIDDVTKQIQKQLGEEAAAPYLEMLQVLRRESIIDLSMVSELRNFKDENRVWNNVMDATRVMPHLTEVNNRIITAIASYNIAKDKLGMNHLDAIEFAKDAVGETQFDYSSLNKSRLFSQNDAAWKPIVFQFMQYTQHMYATMIKHTMILAGRKSGSKKQAARFLTGLLTSHFIAGGAIAATVQPIKWAIGLVLALTGLGDEEDTTPLNVLSGEAYDRAASDLLADLLGTNKISEVARAGLPRLLGGDMSSRIELGQAYMFDLNPKTAETFLGSVLMTFGGPVFGIGGNAFEGMKKIYSDGDVAKGIEMMTPKIVRDATRTFRYATEGLTDANGYEIIGAKDMDPQTLFWQAVGFAPSQIAEKQQQRMAIKDAQQFEARSREDVLKVYRKAKSGADIAKALEARREYNRRFPQNPITVSTLLRARAGRMDTQERIRQTGGVNLPPRQRQYVEEGSAYNTR
jgi:hypothetical protein